MNGSNLILTNLSPNLISAKTAGVQNLATHYRLASPTKGVGVFNGNNTITYYNKARQTMTAVLHK